MFLSCLLSPEAAITFLVMWMPCNTVCTTRQMCTADLRCETAGFDMQAWDAWHTAQHLYATPAPPRVQRTLCATNTSIRTLFFGDLIH